MTATRKFKVCCNCRAQASLGKRVCPRCKGVAVWREPTAKEVADRAEADRRVLETFDSLMCRGTQ
jgi:predicted amidophosphoribosyltransferase